MTTRYPVKNILFTCLCLLFLLAGTAILLAILSDVHITQAGATTLVGLGAFFIGYMQWRSNAQKVKLDYYNRRYAIFAEMKDGWETAFNFSPYQKNESLGKRFAIGHSPEIKKYHRETWDAIKASFLKTREAKFLFGADIVGEIDRFYAQLLKYVDITYAEYKLPYSADDSDRDRIEEEVNKARDEAFAMFEDFPERLKKYLDISSIH